MKLEISKDWCMKMADQEEGEIGAGALARDPWPQYRHKKRGTTYTVMGQATMQAEGPLDNVKVVIYQSNSDGSMWVRPVTEFEDGRFEAI